MSLKVYKCEPGQCMLVMHDPAGAEVVVEVRKVSGLEAVLDSACALRENQYIYATLQLRDGPKMALSALVVTSSAGGTLVQWCHSKPKDADKLDARLQKHLELPVAPPPAPPAPAVTATAASGTAPPAAVAPSPAKGEPPAPGATPPATSTPSPAPVSPPASAAAGVAGRAALPAAAPREPARPARKPRRGARAERPAAKAADSKPTATADAAVDDGTDVAAKIRKKAKVVRASDLAARVETVQILSTGMIKGLIKEAVEEATALLGGSIQESERKRLLEESEAGFAERLEMFKAEKAGLEQKSKALEAQLQKAQALLEEERSRVVRANQFTVSDAGILELEQRMGRLLDHAVKAGGVGADLERDMREVVARLLDDEREKIREHEQQAQNDRISLLEKKVGRLAGSLEHAEAERDRAQRRAQALEASGGLGLRNVYDVGLDDDDPSKEKKLSLLKQIYEFNQEVRRQLEAQGKLPAGRPPRAPAAQEPPASAAAAVPDGAASPAVAPPTPTTDTEPAATASPATDAVALPDEGAPADGAPEEGPPDKVVANDEGEVGEPVLAEGEGGEVDPDDMPWEPGPDAAAAAAGGRIRKLKSRSDGES